MNQVEKPTVETGMKPIRVGIAGLGRAGWNAHYGELKHKPEHFIVMAVTDPIPLRRQTAEENGIRAYETIEEMVQDPDIELVDIATRSSDHYAHGMLALAAGKDIQIEKPFAQTYEEALELCKAAEANGRRIFIRHNRRFDADFLHVSEIIASGILGDVYQIRLTRHNYQRRADWQTIKAFGGGQLLNWGPHIIDHGLQLLESPVKQVWSDLKHVVAAGDAEDHLKIILKGENGRIVDLEISGGIAINSPTYMVYGTRGALSLTDNDIHLRYLDPDVPLAKLEANPGTPGEAFGKTGTYESGEQLVWIEKKIPVKPTQTFNIWDELYASYRHHQAFQIRMEEALEVVRIIDEVKKGTSFM
jgi:scyllo-inositol 2-dehydrogenase (NADP+)